MNYLNQDTLTFISVALIWLTVSVLAFRTSNVRHIVAIMHSDGKRTTAKAVTLSYVLFWPLAIVLMIALQIIGFLLGSPKQRLL